VSLACIGETPGLPVWMQIETSADSHFVILSEAKDLVFPCSYEILRSLRSLRMTSEGTFAEVSTCYEKAPGPEA